MCLYNSCPRRVARGARREGEVRAEARRRADGDQDTHGGLRAAAHRRPISLVRLSLLRLLDSNFAGNSMWAWKYHPLGCTEIGCSRSRPAGDGRAPTPPLEKTTYAQSPYYPTNITHTNIA